jgi:hypothetical protein
VGLLNSLFGFRWSLYIVRNENELVYVMHENSVLELLDYVIVGGFGKGLSPVEPWSLFINFNKNHKNIKLLSEHFRGENPSPTLIQTIELIDPRWRVKPGKAVFMEAATKKVLKISNHDPNEPMTNDYLERRLEMIKSNITEPPDFYGVIHEVFGR